jgi:glycosyltransferase involved in cell wall biosynthesis
MTLFRYPMRMKLLMVSGDRSLLQGKKSAFWYTLDEFRKHWERVDVIAPRVQMENGKWILRQAQEENTNPFPNVFFHPSPRGLWYQPWWILTKGDELIKEHHHDVMTVHEYPPFYNGIGATWLHRSKKIPYAIEIHHVVGYPAAASFSESVGRMLSRAYLNLDTKKAAAVRTVNQSTKTLLTSWGIPATKIHVVPSFYLDRRMLQANSAVPKKYDLVFCARLMANKGLDVVLKALATVPSVSLLVIGDGPERLVSEKLAASLGIMDRVTFVGWLPSQEEVVAQMPSAKAFVMHSLSEGGPRVALEAMALGLPIIATRVGVHPEVIKDGINGVFTDGTVENLAANITKVLGNASFAQHLGSEAKSMEMFEKEKLVKDYAEFLKSLCVS